MPDLSATDRQTIAARCAAATPGPWDVTMPLRRDQVIAILAMSETHATAYCVAYCVVPAWEQRCADAEFIAHCRQDVPALLAALATAEAERDAARAALARWQSPALTAAIAALGTLALAAPAMQRQRDAAQREWLQMRAALQAAEAERTALRQALAWAFAEGGWRLPYQATTPLPPGVVTDHGTSDARWQWPPDGSGEVGHAAGGAEGRGRPARGARARGDVPGDAAGSGPGAPGRRHAAGPLSDVAPGA